MLLVPSGCTSCLRSNAASEQQCNNNDQEDAADTNSGMTKTVSIPAKSATEAAKQVNDKNDNENGSERYPDCSLARNIMQLG